MKRLFIFALALTFCQLAVAQTMPKRIKDRLPEGTTIHGNIPYNNDTLKKHLLDIYVPENAARDIHTWWWMDRQR